MSQTQTNLKRSGNTTIDITSAGSTDPIVFISAFATFGITFKFTGADADPKLTLEGANGNNNWVNILSEITDLNTGAVTSISILMTKAFSDTSTGIDSMSGDNIPFKDFRIAIDPNGATTGTMTAVINTELE